MAWEYSEKTKQLFMDAIAHKKESHIGEIENPDGEGFHGSLVCGDAIKLTFSVKKDENNPENDVITAVRYLTFGCTSAIAASEALCIIIESKKLTPLKALSLTKEDIVDFLNGLPTQKIHCSIMGIEALHSAIANWAKKRGLDPAQYGLKISGNSNEEEASRDKKIVCRCMNLSRGYLVEQIRDLNLKSVEEVVSILKVGSVCGSCIDEEGGIRDLLKEVHDVTTDNYEDSQEKTPYQLSKQIEKVLQQDIIPVLKRDGGNLEIIDIRNTKLYFTLKGTCKSCSAATNTVEYTIQQTLRDKVDPKIEAIRVD
ncbi:MAG: iron-sulfur cluster assembly scaffold protein [Oligoflexia bacterium]|nr:iron-sulfur cluster assembly scaffold protein [Oligoflexia bacterium]